MQYEKASSTQFSIQLINMPQGKKKQPQNTPKPLRSFLLDNFHFHKEVPCNGSIQDI